MTTISAKGQIVIPLEFRKKFNLMPGTEVKFSEDKGRLFVSPESVKPENTEFLSALAELEARPAIEVSDDEINRWLKERSDKHA